MVIRFIDVLPYAWLMFAPAPRPLHPGSGRAGLYATVARVAHGEDCLSVSDSDRHSGARLSANPESRERRRHKGWIPAFLHAHCDSGYNVVW
jgi:hypothetical protein